MIIAIDGPASSRKGTVSINIALKYNLRFLNSGALYRAVGLLLLRDKTLNDNNFRFKAISYSQKLKFDFTEDFDILLDGEDVSEVVRDNQVSMLAARAAQIKKVRETLDVFQLEFIEKHKKQGVVIDGRDIGTYLIPDADLKLFLTCPIADRAKRRQKQLRKRLNQDISLSDVLNSIVERDKMDTERELRPLQKADDAITVDMSQGRVKDILYVIDIYINRAINRESK